MTEDEKNRISAGLLIAATATERLMQEWLNMEHGELRGESKMLFNNMQHHVRAARHYYERLTDRIATVLYESDKDSKRIDYMRQDADAMIRFYLRVCNAEANGYSSESVENALRRLTDGKDNIISDEMINRFKTK